jgi:hypothetical protein
MIMFAKASINPINSLLFISDPEGGVPPTPIRGPMILSTSSCISFRCYPEQDGSTEVTLGGIDEVDPGGVPAFEGELETPSHAVVVSTADLEAVLQAVVQGARTKVKIWLSHPQWPDKVVVGLR